jgi:hypothetical protein
MRSPEKEGLSSGSKKGNNEKTHQFSSGTPGEEVGTSRGIFLDPLGKELFPSPTLDPLDPLNWPRWRKYLCVFIVMYMYFLFTYLSNSQPHH